MRLNTPRIPPLSDDQLDADQQAALAGGFEHFGGERRRRLFC